MTTRVLGRVAPLYKGNYSNSTNYIKFDVAFDGESSFISKQGTAEAPNVGNALTDETWWGLLCKGNYLAIQPLTDSVTQLRSDLSKRYYIDKSIYADAPLGDKLKQICSVKELSISGKVTGYLYWIQAKNTNEGSQLTVFRSLESAPTVYTQFVHFTALTSTRKSGKNAYTAVFSSGETAKILIDWDELDYDCNNLTPNLYILKNDVYNGGVLFNKPIADNSITTPKIVDNSVTTPKIVDNSVTTPKIADNSVSSNKLKSNSILTEKIIDKAITEEKIEDKIITSTKLAVNDMSVNQNIVKISDIYSHSLWSSGDIIEIGNKDFNSYIKTNSAGLQADWQSYYSVFIKKTDMEMRGIDFSNPVYLDFRCKTVLNNVGIWVILRYSDDDSKSFYTSGTTDAIFTKTGTLQGLNAGDTTTWQTRILNITATDFSLTNLLIPPVYSNKNLYAILFCIAEPLVNGYRESKGVGIFLSSISKYSTLFNALPTGELDKITQQIQLASNRLDALEAGDQTPKIADNSITTPKIADNSITTPKIADNSITSVKLDVNISNSIKEYNDDLALEQNLLKSKNIYASNSWSSGQILEVGNKNFTSYIKTDSVGSQAEWQSYYTAFLRKTELEEMGVDFSEPIYLDFKTALTSASAAIWVILRYGIDDNKSFYTSGTVDAIFNIAGTLQGLNSDDTATWTERLLNVTSSRYSLSKLLIPPVYKGKNLYAVMFCVSEPKVEGLRVSRDIGIFVNSDKEYCTLFRKNNDINEIDNIKLELQSIDSRVDGLEQGINPPLDIYWAAIGDSITNANHNSIYDIPDNDEYSPIDGYPNVYITYKRKNYAYYIAKRNRIKWANYGWGGTCISDVYSTGHNNLRHPFVGDDRLKALKSGIDWNYISLQFGWNDFVFGPLHHREKWLSSTYGGAIGYPVSANQIGSAGFATQVQKDACDAVTGTVNGVVCNTSAEYFFQQFLGSINSTDISTWYGAWNYTLDYLLKTYVNAKILIIMPYIGSDTGAKVIDSCVKIANKWGVNSFDFNTLPYWYNKISPIATSLVNPNSEDGKWYTPSGSGLSPNITGYNQARYSYDTLHPSNLGYQVISKPIERALLEE